MNVLVTEGKVTSAEFNVEGDEVRERMMMDKRRMGGVDIPTTRRACGVGSEKTRRCESNVHHKL